MRQFKRSVMKLFEKFAGIFALICFSFPALSKPILRKEKLRKYYQHDIEIQTKEKFSVTVSTTVEVDGYNGCDFTVDAYPLQLALKEDHSSYLILGSVSCTQIGMLNPPDPYMETFSKKIFLKIRPKTV